jgi:hypothetical protein
MTRRPEVISIDENPDGSLTVTVDFDDDTIELIKGLYSVESVTEAEASRFVNDALSKYLDGGDT